MEWDLRTEPYLDEKSVLRENEKAVEEFVESNIFSKVLA